MKTRAKKCGVFVALAAVLLLSAALVTTCVESISPDGLAIPQWEDPFVNFQPPEGMGYIRLNIASDESNARTVLPTGSTLASIVEFTVHVGTGTTLAQHGGRIAVGNISDPITLNQATYNVEVRGYADSSNKVVAVGSLSGVVISGSPNSKTVTLHEVYDSAGGATGTFSWTFTLPSATADVVDSATMTVSNWSSPGNTIPPGLVGVDVKTAPTSVGIAIPSGYYYVDVTLRKASHRTQTYREIVHIANGLTSTWAKNNFAALSKNVYTVTFSDPSGGGTSPITGVTHNATIAKPTAPTYGGKTFGGWFIDSAATTREWIFSDHTWAGTSPPDPDPIPSADKVIYDLTLYAKWTPPFENGNLSLNVGFTLTGDKAFTLSVNPIVYTAANLYDGSANHIITATVDNAVAQGFANIVWYYLEDVAGTPTKRELSTGDTLSINLDTTIYTALRGQGEHPIIVEADVGGVTGYSATLTLKMQ